MTDFLMTTWTEEDLAELLRLNQAEVPHVGDLNPQSLEQLLAYSYFTGVARVKDQIAGFIVALTPGQEYTSLNYRWFCDYYREFLYVDRIVVAPEFKGQGLGRALYDAVAQNNPVKAGVITCEVNIQPLNQSSLDFHARIGFVEVGQQDTEGGKKRVSLLAKNLP